MTKRHFTELAQILGETNASKETVDRIVTLCADANPRFSPSRFRDAVEAARQ